MFVDGASREVRAQSKEQKLLHSQQEPQNNATNLSESGSEAQTVGSTSIGAVLAVQVGYL